MWNNIALREIFGQDFGEIRYGLVIYFLLNFISGRILVRNHLSANIPDANVDLQTRPTVRSMLIVTILEHLTVQ